MFSYPTFIISLKDFLHNNLTQKVLKMNSSSPAPCSTRSWYFYLISYTVSLILSNKPYYSRNGFLVYINFCYGFEILRSISDDSLRRYVFFASERCIQELLSASDSDRAGNGNDGWKMLAFEDGVEISKRRSGSGSFHTFRSRWVLKSVSPEQFITVANAIDAAKVLFIYFTPILTN